MKAVLLFLCCLASALADFDGEKEVGFFIYSKRSPAEGVEAPLGASDAVISSGYNASYLTKFMTHGFGGSYRAADVQTVKNAYVEETDYNVIAVDWSHLATDWDQAIANNHNIGQYIAKYIQFLVSKHDTKLSDVHVIGHSLGGELVGFVGDILKNPKVARITGLDPAQQDYVNKPKEDRLDKEDAVLVDVFHTSTIGLQFPIGHVDYFPNGGVEQTGCNGDAGCNHARSWLFYADTIRNPSKYKAVQCDTLEEAQAGNCTGPAVYLGAFMPSNTTGIFYQKVPAI